MNQFSVTFYEDGVRTSRIIEAESRDEALQKAWGMFDVDDVYISEMRRNDL